MTFCARADRKNTHGARHELPLRWSSARVQLGASAEAELAACPEGRRLATSCTRAQPRGPCERMTRRGGIHRKLHECASRAASAFMTSWVRGHRELPMHAPQATAAYIFTTSCACDITSCIYNHHELHM